METCLYFDILPHENLYHYWVRSLTTLKCLMKLIRTSHKTFCAVVGKEKSGTIIACEDHRVISY